MEDGWTAPHQQVKLWRIFVFAHMPVTIMQLISMSDSNSCIILFYSARGKFYLMTSDTPPFALGYAYNNIRKNKLRFTTISRRTIMQYIHSPHV